METPALGTPLDLRTSLEAVVTIRTEIPEDSFTAPLLGTEREGSGVLIRADGLILTIGYLILEAESVWIITSNGSATPGHIVGYDHDSGFGLIQALGKLHCAPAPLGDSDACKIGDDVIVSGREGLVNATEARILTKREFAGAWEYVLDEAIITAPAHSDWSGSALFDRAGRLLGIASLFLQQVEDDPNAIDGNLSVPINLLKPIIDDIQGYGRISKPPRPWLGIYLSEVGDQIVVAGLADQGPAAESGIRVGDILVEVGPVRAKSVAHAFRTLWSLGPSGTIVPLTLERGRQQLDMSIKSASRADFLRQPLLH